ncbi:hypothetical protein D3C86_2137630 [compost metagenome]
MHFPIILKHQHIAVFTVVPPDRKGRIDEGKVTVAPLHPDPLPETVKHILPCIPFIPAIL